MNINELKLDIIQKVIKTDNPGMLNAARQELMDTGRHEYWDTLPEHTKQDLLRKLEESDQDEIIDYEEFIKRNTRKD